MTPLGPPVFVWRSGKGSTETAGRSTMSLLLPLRLSRESGAFGVCPRSAVLSPSSCPHHQLQSLVGMQKETRQAQSRNQSLVAVAPGLRDGAGNLLDGCEDESGQACGLGNPKTGHVTPTNSNVPQFYSHLAHLHLLSTVN